QCDPVNLLVRTSLEILVMLHSVYYILSQNTVKGPDHEIKRVATYKLIIELRKMRLHAKFHTDPDINASPVLFPERDHSLKVRFVIKNIFQPPGHVILIKMICKTDHLQPFFDSSLYHFLRTRLRVMGKIRMHVHICSHFLFLPYDRSAAQNIFSVIKHQRLPRSDCSLRLVKGT